MNSLVNDEFWLLHLTVRMRVHLYEVLTDADLSYRLPGRNSTLGELCRDVIEVQSAYLDSFKTGQLTFQPETAPPELATSVAAIKARTEELDAAVEAVLSALTDEQVSTMIIERGGGFNVPLRLQYQFYREALLIFFAKVSVYLKALDKPLNTQWQHWMG